MIYNFLSHFNYFTIYYAGFVVTAFVVFVGTMIICRNLSSPQVDENKQKVLHDLFHLLKCFLFF